MCKIVHRRDELASCETKPMGYRAPLCRIVHGCAVMINAEAQRTQRKTQSEREGAGCAELCRVVVRREFAKRSQLRIGRHCAQLCMDVHFVRGGDWHMIRACRNADIRWSVFCETKPIYEVVLYCRSSRMWRMAIRGPTARSTAIACHFMQQSHFSAILLSRVR